MFKKIGANVKVEEVKVENREGGEGGDDGGKIERGR